MSNTQFLRIRGRVPHLEGDRFTSIIRLGIERHFGTNTLFAKDHKSSVDGNPS
jgi:hypothetical protein